MYRLKTDTLYVEMLVFLIAGCVNTVSIPLILAHGIYWLILTGFVSANFHVFAFTAFCPSAAILEKAGVQSRFNWNKT